MEKLEYKRSGTSNNKKSNSAKDRGNKKEEIKVKSKKRAKSTKKSKSIITIILIIVFIITSVILLFCLPCFNINEIVIEGSSKYTDEEILEKSEVSRNKNIFLQAIKGVSKNINELPYIESANVSLKLPNRLKINVKERTSTYLAFNSEKNNYYKIDKYGVILEEGDIQNRKNDELLVYGFIFDDEVILGSNVKEIDLSKIKVYENINNEFINNKINASISKVNFANSLTTITLNDKLNVIFPNDTDIKYKMSFLKSILLKIGEDSSGVIDMTKTNPVFSSY